MKKNKFKKMIAAGLLVTIALVGMNGCNVAKDTVGNGEKTTAGEKKDAKNTENSKDELKEFRIGVGGSDDGFTAFLGNVAYKLGYLEEELNEVGYTLKIENFGGGGPEINEAIASGSLDGAIYGDFPAFTSKSNGFDTSVIAVVNGKQQYAVIASNPDVKEAKDLEGKKVIVAQGTVSQFFWEHYAEKRGLDTSKIEIINVTSDAQSLLATGEADAYVMTPSSLYYMESLGLGTVIDTSSDVPEGTTTYLFVATNSILKDSPEIGVAVNKALIRANKAIKEDIQTLYDSTASKIITAEFTKKDYQYDGVEDALYPGFTDDVLNHFKELNEWLLSHGNISNKVDINDFVKADLYQEATKQMR